jgi:hypothetical protein
VVDGPDELLVAASADGVLADALEEVLLELLLGAQVALDLRRGLAIAEQRVAVQRDEQRRVGDWDRIFSGASVQSAMCVASARSRNDLG